MGGADFLAKKCQKIGDAHFLAKKCQKIGDGTFRAPTLDCNHHARRSFSGKKMPKNKRSDASLSDGLN